MADCFLCGDPLLEGQAVNSGHVLPLSFVPTAYRSQLTGEGLPAFLVHKRCNSRMSSAEEWVRHDLGKTR